MYPELFILYVEDHAQSCAFYSTLLDMTPIENAPTFVLFALSSGTKLGLWSKKTLEPKPTAAGGGTELAFTVATIDELHQRFAELKAQGLTILQPITEMVFGVTFVVLDPDGHRLRIYKENDIVATQ